MNSLIEFTVIDYSCFSALLGLSIFIGIYYGFISKKKQNSTVEYLLGSKQMKVWPISLSMVATIISAISILGVPSEVYLHGTQYWATIISGLIVAVVTIYYYLPVFFELQETSMFTYLNKRFDPSVRRLVSGLYAFSAIVYLPILIYAPAIAFNQVSGVNLHIIAPIMCIICIFYTTFGGLRGVVWTDALQFTSMMAGVLAVLCVGTYNAGGFGNVYDIAKQGDRIVWFNMDTSTTVRSSFYSNVIGITSLWICVIGVAPECIQRFLSVPTFSDSKKVVWYFCFGHILFKIFAVVSGIIIYSQYQKCDPITVGVVKKADQIFPYYVMDIARNIPGLPGIFIAGVFSAGLSSMSSTLNCVSGTIFVDFVKPIYPNTTEKTASNIMKCLVFIIGCVAVVFVFLVEKLGNIFSLTISIKGITAGPLLGIFTLGMTFPKANKYGALVGTCTALLIVSVLTFGSQLAIANKELVYPSLTFRTDGCEEMGFPDWRTSSGFVGNPNSTTHIFNEHADHANVHPIFKLGFMYYSLLGTLIVLIVGYPVSLITGGQDNLDPRLLAPPIRKLYENNLRKLKEKDREMQLLNGNKSIDVDYTNETNIVKLQNLH